ncbi:hypothetical protein ACFX1T_002515 [Malus domestica]
MEFYPRGDLHVLREKQPGKHFPEHAARQAWNEAILNGNDIHGRRVKQRLDLQKLIEKSRDRGAKQK